MSMPSLWPQKELLQRYCLVTLVHMVDVILLGMVPYISPWRRILEKLTVTQLVNKFPVIYQTGQFTTVFSRAYSWSYTIPLCFFKIRSQAYFPLLRSFQKICPIPRPILLKVIC